MIYDSVDEVRNRLVNTIVCYGGQPVFVADAGVIAGTLSVRILEWPFTRGDGRWVAVADPAFNRFQTVPLGYANYFPDGQHVVWCERLPARRMRQGLCEESFSGFSKGGGRVNFRNFRSDTSFNEMVTGDYPPYQFALDAVDAGSSMAVGRDFAIFRGDEGFATLHYRRTPVGLAFADKVVLTPKTAWMTETINEAAALPDRVEVL